MLKGEKPKGSTRRLRPASRCLAAVLLLMGGLVGSVGCSYETLSAAETDVVLTIQDPDRDYSRYRTYALSPHVTELCAISQKDLDPWTGEGGAGGRGGLDPKACTEVSHLLDKTLLQALEKQMGAWGYEKVSAEEDPDFIVLTGIVARDLWRYRAEYIWCDAFTEYECWYAERNFPYSFTQGTLLIQWIDKKESKPDQLRSIWFAALQGMYSAASLEGAQLKTESAVQQAFLQAPYLRRGATP